MVEIDGSALAQYVYLKTYLHIKIKDMIRILSTFLFLFLAINLVAQVPQSMSYMPLPRCIQICI
jgi:hypothetical protein